MMKALIVEDDIHKREQIELFMRERFPQLDVQNAVSLIGGIRALRQHEPDIVILDMSLPNYDPESDDTGSGMQAFGGEEFLRQARRSKSGADVIVVTQFETFGDDENFKDRKELELELQRDFPGMFRGMVYYHASLSGWAEELEELIEDALARRKA
ncbi:response regulator [Agrobacterium pusense]|uniref:response regulator n=1 Tax=Agrobacterium pusense TaxID=648995 RepID=UPI001C6EAE1E|nr:response regulator [Agrobacterium pusense]MBW9069899.1 response regulator [Agrobacterium pusense]MBW9084862.1 response regulator [Agrobacterium pusense]MBW9125264.1 response regulator [Agrobacterium pusense]MBW9137679.1 response regulator [Agrobacterium pusense]